MNMIPPAFHLLTFYTALLGSGVSNTALGVTADQIVAQANGRYLLPWQARVGSAYVGIDTPVDARINAPSLRIPNLPYLDPLSGTVLPTNVPPVLMQLDLGPDINRSEELTVEASRGVAAAAPATAALWLWPKPPVPVKGPIVSAQLTGTTTIAAGTWVTCVPTMTQTLTPGLYAIVGMAGYGTNLLYARIVFPQGGPRPGVLCQGAAGEWSADDFRRGKAGIFGYFDSYAIPVMELMGAGAGTAQTFYWDLLKIQ